MSKVLNQSFDFVIFENTLGFMGQSTRQLFMHHWLKLLNDELDIDIWVTVESFPRIDMIYLQRPFAQLNDFVSQIAEFHMRKVLSEFIDALFRKNCLDEIVAITD